MSTLKGLRIAITAIDLEQSEHRGIASVSKSIISFLAGEGAEVFLITGISSGKKSHSKKTSKDEVEKDYVNKILSELKKGDDFKKINFSFKKPSLIIRFIWHYKYLLYLTILTYLRNGHLVAKLYKIRKSDIRKFGDCERMSYLKDISGLIAIKNIFKICRLRSKRLFLTNPKFNLDKYNIDLVISSSPLSLVKYKKSNSKFIQIIHDTIPIKYKKHPESAFDFFNKLNDSHLSECIYVSRDTKKDISELLKTKKINYRDDNNIINPFPSINLKTLKISSKIKKFRNIKNNFILFNSSIVDRKNLENLIEYYAESNLSKNNISLLVAGKLHNSDYVRKIKKLCQNIDNIFLLDYVSELDKSWLYLNSLMLVSTSSLEGFGIPVLDAITINLPVLATDIPSYRELKEISPKNRKIKLIDLKDKIKWVKEFNNIKNIVKKDRDILKRVKSFEEYNAIYSKKLSKKFKSIINNN